MFELYATLLGTLLLDAILLGYLAWAFWSPRYADARISEAVPLKVPRAARLRVMATSSVLSLVTILGATYLLHRWLISGAAIPLWKMVLQGAGILLVYDFAYYFLHRAMHIKRLMRWVHGVHHKVRNPSALESFYLHPAELLAGLTLLLASTAVVGPVHPYAFVGAFFVYSTLNILIHSGLYFAKKGGGRLVLSPIDALTRKHHVHHMEDLAKNYSSLTPLPDLLFGTHG